MTTITIAYEVSADKFEKIQQFINKEYTYNPNHNGEVFNFDRGDFTQIDNDSYDHVDLMVGINKIINGECDE